MIFVSFNIKGQSLIDILSDPGPGLFYATYGQCPLHVKYTGNG